VADDYEHLEEVEVRLYPEDHPEDVKRGRFVRECEDGSLVVQIMGETARPMANVRRSQVRPLDAVTQLGALLDEAL